MPDPELNPYSSPERVADQQEIEPSAAAPDEIFENVWRDGRQLIARRGSNLPSRCVKCNAQADYWKKQALTWHHPGLYFLLLNPGIYLIVIYLVQQSTSLRIGVCRRHLAQRKRAVFVAWLMGIAGLAAVFVAASLTGTARLHFALPLLILGAAVISLATWVGVFTARLLWADHIDPYFACVEGACPEYLAELPEWMTDAVDPIVPKR